MQFTTSSETEFIICDHTIEAGIKEGKGVFQMHHLKVRAAPALWLQEQFAAFAANFVRWAAHWLSTQCYQEPEQWLDPVAASTKTLGPGCRAYAGRRGLAA